MCGIHGVLVANNSGAPFGVNGFMSDGFIAGSVRGIDSSGVFQVDKKKKPFMYKRCLAGPDFIQNNHTKRFITDTNTSLITVGHVRAATHGKVVDDNAHPFIAERPTDDSYIMGVHNGTLNAWQYRPEAKEFDVDSAWAFDSIARLGMDAFKNFHGAFVFAWWDTKEPNILRVVRNKERPLHFVMTKDKKAMLLASEAGMLAWLAERNRCDVTGDIYTFGVDKEYRIDVGGKEITWTKHDLPTWSSAYKHTGGYKSPMDRDKDDFIEGVRKAATATGEVSQAPTPLVAMLPALSTTNASEKDGSTTTTPKRQTGGSDTAATGFDEAASGDIGSLDWVAKNNWYDNSSATLAERQQAYKLNIMGEIHWLEGIYFEGSELLGEVRDYVAGQGHVTYSAVMRNCGMSTGLHFMDNRKQDRPGDYAVVIGRGSDKLLGEYVVMAPLRDEGKQFVEANVKKLAAA